MPTWSEHIGSLKQLQAPIDSLRITYSMRFSQLEYYAFVTVSTTDALAAILFTGKQR